MTPSQKRLARLGRSFSLLLVMLLVGGMLVTTSPSFAAALAAATDTDADVVTGQASFLLRDNTTPATTMNVPTGVAIGIFSSTNVISLVADRDNNRVLLYNMTASGPVLADSAAQAQADNLPTTPNAVYGQIALANTTPGTSPSTLNHPTAVAIAPTTALANPKVYIADTGNNRVLAFNTLPTAVGSTNNADLVLGQSTFIDSTGGGGFGQMSGPQGVAVDKNNQVYVADTGNNRILVFTNPTVSGAAASFTIGGTIGAAANQLNGPAGVAIDADGNLYVADTNNNRVLKYNTPLSNGMSASKVFGQAGFGSSSPGTTSTTLRNPSSVAVDSLGNMYVADKGNHRVLLFRQSATDSDTTADKVFGQKGSFTSSIVNNGAVVGSPDFDTLNSPVGVAVNPNIIDAASSLKDYRDLFVADSNNHRVLQYWTPEPNPTPTLTAPTFSPSSGVATLGSTGTTMVSIFINGRDFAAGATVDWNGIIFVPITPAPPPPTPNVTRISTKLIRLDLPDTLFDALITAGIPTAALPVKVNNPAALRFPNLTPLSSSPADFPICFGKPVIGTNGKFGVTPTTTEAGSAGFTLTITGTNFLDTPAFPMSISWGGQILSGATIVNNVDPTPDTLTVFVPVDQVALPGTYPIILSNFQPTPAGACATASTSVARDFILTSPAPTITGFAPASVIAGSTTPLNLVVKGTGFITSGPNKTQVYFNGSLYASAVISDSTQILLPGINATGFTPGNIPVRVVNPPNTPSSTPPNGGEATKNFPVSDTTTPLINILIPDKTVAGSPAFLLTIRGVNFSAGAKVFWNGAERTVVTRSTTELVAAILPDDVKTVGTANVTVDDLTDAIPASAPAVFTITPLSVISNQTITFAQPANVKQSASPVTLSATASSGLPVSFTSGTPTICTVSGSQVTLLSLGTCTITASQAGNASFNAATPVIRSFQVKGNVSVYVPLIIR